MTKEDWEKMQELLQPYINQREKEQERKPCPSCGHCPTCGRSKLDPLRFVPQLPLRPWYDPYFLQQREYPTHQYVPSRTSDAAGDYGWFVVGQPNVKITCD